MTTPLYYLPIYRCAAQVLSCRETAEGWAVELDRTCFYPEGGGQPGDQGRLGDVWVLDTREEDGHILHLTDGPLAVGAVVTGEIDRARREDLTRQHSGEHMVSGVAHRRFGVENVGFHMGADVITIDFDRVLSWEQLRQVDEEVNRLIQMDLPVRCWTPAPEALAAIAYRSKKAIDGPVRLVEIPGADVCACCGTHVRRTGEIGLVKLLRAEKFHSGIRLELVCGGRALAYLSAVWDQNRLISRQLSARDRETAGAVEALARELEAVKQQRAALERAWFAAQAEALRDRGDVFLRLEGLSPDSLRRAAAAIQETCGGRAAVFSGDDESGYKYAAGLPGGDLRDWVRTLNEALRGRGGGKPAFVQGSVHASWAEIERFFTDAQ